jgi:very-short-patch-repair endonuclease
MRYKYNHLSRKGYRRNLRNNPTDVEKLLWHYIRGRQLPELRFLRQYSVGPYIIDFYCPKLRLAIELDGGQHSEKNHQEYDKKREHFLADNDIKVLRFWNNEVLADMESVLEMIHFEIKNRN